MIEVPSVYICIPVYYSGPEIPRVLDELLTSIEAQDYPDYRLHTCLSIQKCEIDQFVELVKVMTKDLPGSKFGKRSVSSIHPLEDVKGPAMNTNSALEFAGVGRHDGYIKIMNHDDILNSPTAISDMVQTLENSQARWLASACYHTDGVGVKRERLHMPAWPGEKAMVEGVNRIGCPSVVMFDARLQLKCDVDVLYAMDCDMWIQLFQQAGPPVIHSHPDVVVRMWEDQLTENLNIPRQLEQDKATMRKKYGYT